MKKILICALLMLFLVGCDRKDKKDYKKELIEYSSKLEQYNLKAKMTIVREEADVNFDIDVSYLSPKYYKVKIQNESNNNVQVIVKNDEGVYVLTPLLNKQFKFTSDWPLNSSHAYLFHSITKDITNDVESFCVTDDNNYIITSLVDNKTNARLKLQKTTFDKKTNKLLSNTVYDAQENPVVKVVFKTFNDKPGLKASDFDVETINNTVRLELSEGTLNGALEKCVPTFIPTGFELDKSVIETNYTVFTYANNEEVYTITSVITEVSKALTVSREFEDFILLDSTVGFINGKSLTFFYEDLLVSIYNDKFDLEEVVLMANSFK